MKFYKRIDENGNTTTVERYDVGSNNIHLIEITKEEYDEFINNLMEINKVNRIEELETLGIAKKEEYENETNDFIKQNKLIEFNKINGEYKFLTGNNLYDVI